MREGSSACLLTFMGGSVAVRSTYGEGTTFSIHLPLATPPSPDLAEDGTASAA